MTATASTNTNRCRPRIVLAVAVAMLATAVGCGGSSTPTAHVSGKVTLDGKAIPSDAEASVMFVNDQVEGEEGKVSVPINTSDGSYDSPNTPQGDIRAYFSITRKGPPKVSERTGEEYQETINLVPAKVATGIPLTVSGDNTNQNFEL